MKTIIKIFICLSLIYTPFFAFAGAAEKWEVLENNYDHVTNKVKIEARKITQSAANSGRYKVEIPVNANTLGATAKRMLWVGAAVGAITALVEGVGWIIDTGSQTIKRPLPSSIDPSQIIDGLYICVGNTCNTINSITYSTFNAAYAAYNPPTTPIHHPQFESENKSKLLAELEPLIKQAVATPNKPFTKFSITLRYKTESGYEGTVYVNLGVYAKATVQMPEQQYETVSDEELGNEILGKGTEPNSRTQPAENIITDAYSPNNPVQDAPAPQQTLDALENANPEPETEPKGDTKPKPNVDTDGDGEPDAYDPAQPDQGTEFQLPNFCSWASAVCDFFTVQKADNKDIKKINVNKSNKIKPFFKRFPTGLIGHKLTMIFPTMNLLK